MKVRVRSVILRHPERTWWVIVILITSILRLQMLLPTWCSYSDQSKLHVESCAPCRPPSTYLIGPHIFSPYYIKTASDLEFVRWEVVPPFITPFCMISLRRQGPDHWTTQVEFCFAESRSPRRVCVTRLFCHSCAPPFFLRPRYWPLRIDHRAARVPLEL